VDGRLAGLTARLLALGAEAGLDRMGVCSVEPFTDTRLQIRSRKEQGKSARLGFTFSDPDTSTDIRQSFPWAKRLVVGIRSYLPDAGGPGVRAPGEGRVARFAVTDSYQPLISGLEAVATKLREAGYRAETLADDSRLVDRAAAVRAGVGWWGKSAMVLAPGVGPWFLIGSVVTDACLAASERMERSCGTCRACLPACPTQALVAPGVLDARLCLAAIAQSPGVIPRDLRVHMEDRIYGCDECLAACPPGGRLLERAVRKRGSVDLVHLLRSVDKEILATFDHFYLPARRPRILRRNALVALGNTGTAEHLPVVAGYLGNPDWMLRLHAVWAVHRLGSRLSLPSADAFLHHAAAREKSPEVMDEYDLAGVG
jgi:epoxyqueuosine reductase